MITDSGNDRFQEFTAEGLFSSYGGGPGTEPGQFLNPNGIAIDSRGTLYIVDTDNHRIQVFSSQ
jgi:sugar lactone lactonase YvrE